MVNKEEVDLVNDNTRIIIKRKRNWLDGFRIGSDNEYQAVESNLVDPYKLASLRIILLIYCIIVLVFNIIYNYDTPLHNYVYVTVFSFYGLILYLMLSIYLSLTSIIYPTSSLNKFILYLQRILYHINLIISFVVTVVYWSVIFPKDDQVDNSTYLFLNISLHALNLGMMLSELFLTRIRFQWAYSLVAIFCTLLYLPLAILVHESFGIWTYDFINYIDHPTTFGIFIIGIIIVELGYGGILLLIHKLRDFMFKRKSKIVRDSQFGSFERDLA